MSKVKKKAPIATAKAAPTGQHTTKTTTAAPHHKSAYQPEREVYFVFGRTNYLLMLAGIVMLLVGYVIMWGGGTDPNHPEIFDAAAKYSFTRITLAPIIIVLGLCVEAVAIMYKDKARHA